MSIDRHAHVPLYAQLEAILRRQIGEGQLKPGDIVPTESELGRHYKVSRITVRAALESLTKDGLLERQPGRGTFVRASEVEPWSCLTSFTEQMLRQGRTPRTKMLKLRVVRPEPDVAGALRLGSGEEAVIVERLRLVDEQPAALMRAFIPRRFVRGISRRDFASTGREQSILYVLERRFNLAISEGEETTAPVCLTQPDAGLLGLQEGSPVVYKSCVIHNSQGEPVLLERAYWCTPQVEQVRRAGAGD